LVLTVPHSQPKQINGEHLEVELQLTGIVDSGWRTCCDSERKPSWIRPIAA
jgi:hypothetical protein